MLIFLDTEFTNFIDARLISIGLVSEDGREFYAEVAGIDPFHCTPFVCETVLPLLGANESLILSPADLRSKLREWLAQFSSSDIIVFDFNLDYLLLLHAVGETPAAKIEYVSGAILASDVYDAARNETFAGDRPQHHALTDAHAMRNGYLAYQKARQQAFSYLMEE